MSLDLISLRLVISAYIFTNKLGIMTLIVNCESASLLAACHKKTSITQQNSGKFRRVY